MYNDVMVSIVMPTYNAEKFIADSIESVVNQTHENWELLITDDCSRDRTVEIVKRYQKKERRISLVQLRENSGAAVARNCSIQRAKGEYIAFLDSDDIWEKEKLKRHLEFMISNGYAFSHTEISLINENGKFIKSIRRKEKESLLSIMLANKIGTSSVMYNNKILGKMYMRNLRKRQDLCLWLDILKKTEFVYCLNEPLTMYRCCENSLSSNKMTLFKYHVQVYQEVFGFGRLKACLFFYLISLPCIFYKKINDKFQ